ncbi:hypothetical protein F5884DRAFT_789460 [Xylogone sp. PMI_703]|nr:hypothetical protein F5884DRAFT_789460 [Xylogone sp. PMI_703]
MKFSSLLLLAPLSALAAPAPAVDEHGFSILDCDVRLVYEFPIGTYVENLAVRSNGQVLMCPLTIPSLFMIDPLVGGKPTVAYTFPDILGLAGIAEYKPDVFAVITGDYNFTSGDFGPGTWSIWSVDLNGVSIGKDGNLIGTPSVHKIASIPQALFLNGLSLLSASEQTLLAGDDPAGLIWKVDINSGTFEVIIQNNETATVDTPIFGNAGVDGLHLRDKALYFSNVGAGEFFTAPINEDGTLAGPVTTIAHAPDAIDLWDDFTFDRDGRVFLTTGGGNSVEIISPDGTKQKILVGNINSTAIAEPTSAAFGRHPTDQNVLYVTTAGGLVTPVNGDITIGGQLVAVTTPFKGVQDRIALVGY